MVEAFEQAKIVCQNPVYHTSTRGKIMTLKTADVEYIAHLARLAIDSEAIPHYKHDLSRILEFVGQMNKVDTTNIEPMAHPLDAIQRLRPDEVTESDQWRTFQSIAPQVEAGVYLIPKVID
ncbi:aspartyl/glutamyl-tRNA(Asn/Gln) amidotransferase subunit C [Nitrosococcus oceani]|nr:aspartyl/glutamyl-tRNA(Asn/Gln) amidotransferase subunit C [Nitrosococcus oceani]